MIDHSALGTAYRRLRDRFRAAKLGTPEMDARLLIADVLKIEPAGLLIEDHRVLDQEHLEEIEKRAGQRLDGMPVGRIIGRRGFWGFDLELNEGTLEPRPDTETLVESVLDWVAIEKRQDEALRILDIGTGSGAILIALLSELPTARGVGTDISEEAAKQAKRNLRSANLEARAGVVCCSYFKALTGRFDIVVSNPPYIRRSDIPLLDREVRTYDPILALDGGVDGLMAYRSIAAVSPQLLDRAGRLFVEIGHDQSSDVIGIFSAEGFCNANTIKDLSGHKRVISVTPPELSR